MLSHSLPPRLAAIANHDRPTSPRGPAQSASPKANNSDRIQSFSNAPDVFHKLIRIPLSYTVDVRLPSG